MEEEKIKKLKKLQLLEEEPSLAIFDELEDIQENLEPIKEALSGIEFIKGEKGEDGKDGINGQDGYTPIKGVDYFDGKNGVIGKDGKDGKDGINGNDGNDGVNGTDGLNGKNGKDGEKGEKGDKPNHKWNGTKLAFEKPNGEWGREVDLLGKPGKGGNGIFTYGGANLDNYLKLDQTTPQTTVGRFNFPNIAVDTNTLYTDSVNHRVGIGTTNPGYRLQVDGVLGVKETSGTNGTRAVIFADDNGAYYTMDGSNARPIIFKNWTNGAETMRIDTNGLVGIGTTAPNEQLEITKNFRLPATSGTTPYGIIYKDGSPFIHDFNYGDNGTVTTAGRNTFVGINAGNFAMGSTATSATQASYNTGVGFYSLYSNTTGYNNTANGSYSLYLNTTGYQNTANGYASLRYNTTGSNNTANGMQSLYLNTTGSNNTANGMYSLIYNTTGANNTANGYASLFSNTTGYNNTANGYHSLYSNTTGANNTALGRDSLRSNTTGSQNSALGYYSGRYLANGTTGRSTGDNGIYLGFNSMASADGTNNEIVIGANAVGKGSSTAIIGNESLTALYVSGQVIPATLTSDPTGIEGGIYFNTTDKHFYGYNGTDWKQLDN